MVGLPRQYIRYPDGGIEDVKLDDPDDVAWYAEWFNERKNRQIARTAVPYGEDQKKAVIVSTIFLGFEHGTTSQGEPILWETLASMPEGYDDLERRYASEQTALAGHADIAKRVDAILNIDVYEIEALLEDLAGAPEPGEVKHKQVKDPTRTAADPDCAQCKGSGTVTSMLGTDTPCDCTLGRRPAPKSPGPKTKSPDPNCPRCAGTGEDRLALVPDTVCECSIVRRKQNAQD